MPAYHSKYTDEACPAVGNIAMLPLRTNVKGPAPRTADEEDIIDETLLYFKANVFFKNYEVKNTADRLLIYLTLYATDCIVKLQRSPNKKEAFKEMHTLAISKFDLPGEAGFPLNSVYTKPVGNEVEKMRQYLTQCRQEMGLRIVEKVFGAEDKPSKWWTCFARRKFMDKTLTPLGRQF